MSDGGTYSASHRHVSPLLAIRPLDKGDIKLAEEWLELAHANLDLHDSRKSPACLTWVAEFLEMVIRESSRAQVLAPRFWIDHNGVLQDREKRGRAWTEEERQSVADALNQLDL
jgi:hypothetical protein